MFLFKNIKLIREKLALTQPEFGNLLDATKAMIQSYENEKAFPKNIFIEKLSYLVDIPVDRLENEKLKYSDINVPPRAIKAVLLKNSIERIYDEITMLEVQINTLDNDRATAEKEYQKQKERKEDLSQIRRLLDTYHAKKDIDKHQIYLLIEKMAGEKMALNDLLSIGKSTDGEFSGLSLEQINTLARSDFFTLVGHFREKKNTYADTNLKLRDPFPEPTNLQIAAMLQEVLSTLKRIEERMNKEPSLEIHDEALLKLLDQINDRKNKKK